MQNITRTLTTFKIKAYDIAEIEGGEPQLAVIAETLTCATSMTKAAARAALSQVASQLPRGLHITWEPVESVTYAMAMDKFIEQAIVIKTEAISAE